MLLSLLSYAWSGIPRFNTSSCWKREEPALDLVLTHRARPDFDAMTLPAPRSSTPPRHRWPRPGFYRDATHLVQKCTKPDKREFLQIFRATCVGFLIMGFVGFFVKLVHIPINNILVGGS